MKPSRAPTFFLLLTGLLIATAIVYYPGLRGGFLFDDYANLPALGSDGPINNWPAFWQYITSGTADPTGRPLTLLSFLLDAHNWPADPLPFKRTNLVLHLLNGALLACLLRVLGRMLLPDANQRRVDTAALLGAEFWLLHPLFVSTTLYIVQREAMLPTTFTLLGLLAWLHGRTALQKGSRLSGAAWTLCGLLACTLLGTLSKANGVLLPALALVIEYTLLRTSPNAPLRTTSSLYRVCMLLLAWIPALLILCYLLVEGWQGFVHGISAVRTWTLGQRLLTEPRVLMEYLNLLWLPRPFTPGLFNDNVQASTSLLAPGTTLPALLGVLALIALAWKYRRQHPFTATAILFYFVGQSIESSTISLELYFEHRNYLPALLMFWPLALWLCNVRVPQSTPAGTERNAMRLTMSPAMETTPPHSQQADSSTLTLRKAKPALAVALLMGLGLMTHTNAELWGNTHDQAILWAALNPDSPRAQASAAIAERDAGHPELAVIRLKRLLVKDPDQVQLALNLFSAQCQLGSIDPSTIDASQTALRTSRDTGNLMAHWFDGMMEQAQHPPCRQLNLETIASLLDAAQKNPYLATNPGRRQDLYYLQGHLALIRGNADMALTDFNHGLDIQVRESDALAQAALLGAMGYPRHGLAHLDHYKAVQQKATPPGLGMPRVHAWVLEQQDYWPKELARLRATLRSDAASQPTGNR
ncbi:tetratricopeptide repeat protein [Dyella acidisoli]|uniref:Tetratricopeptide repeat protein n=1 Tax=Dyella acidisoli TaxID=1867834 RepID=A0ABQ5XPS1_9GAMM|nr:tetratricopeptide repeat protein [Dyella acidisoli]GLQ93204.1 hypothetical protein GCM10007901_21550 [Dyella acidisoli]